MQGFRHTGAWRRTVLAVAVAAAAASGCGDHEGPGEIQGAGLGDEGVARKVARQADAFDAAFAGVGYDQRPRKQILFGDFHVHTTFSIDAFVQSLPLLVGGEGAHPPADACDYARYCSALDFWSINDHAEGLTPRHWQETKESIRQCNARAGDPANPDLVSFLGWEWSQVGPTPEAHYGHKNVVLRHEDEASVPKRPISSNDPTGGRPELISSWRLLALATLAIPDHERVLDLRKFLDELYEMELCPPGVDTRELPEDCHEGATSPDLLFEKLAQGGWDARVIPHGNTWGFYSPPGISWDKQLAGDMHDPSLQTMVEVFSGHGSSEEYRDWRAVAFDSEGRATCPEPTSDYEPCCWRAGEIIRSRCGEEEPAEVCEARVADARRNHAQAGSRGHLTVPGATTEDWLGCGQCPDCFLPAFNYRPGGSSQYALAISNFDEGEPRRFRFGFIASSDNHSARPGTGYKETDRIRNTEARGAREEKWRRRLLGGAAGDGEEARESVVYEPPENAAGMLRTANVERQASFFMTGGLVATHAAGRSRDAIWEALDRREVYGTSGERILLWFDLLNAADGVAPMGSEASVAEAPRFRVRAVGAPKQAEGCPEHAVRGLGGERLDRLCGGECYHPTDERRTITRIEVVRIRPQERPGEPVDGLIQDPWRRFACTPDPAGCTVEFEDPDFTGEGREVVYYVRAIQEPTPVVNAENLRCRYDEAGRCVEVEPCFGDYRVDPGEDCLAPAEERAWSSPIFVEAG